MRGTEANEAKERFEKLADELAADRRPFRELSRDERRARLHRVVGIGRGLFSSSEEFARRKQGEIDIEERPASLGPSSPSWPSRKA